MNINFQINGCLFRWETHEIRKSILSQFKLEICVQNTVWFDCSYLYMFVISDGAEKLPDDVLWLLFSFVMNIHVKIEHMHYEY